jgi:hypothetical protein
MTRRPLGIAMIIVFFSSAAAARAADTVFDGHYWRKCSVEEKRLFVHGVMNGILLGQDRVVRYGQADRGAKALAPECQRAVVGVVNTLEKQIGKWDRKLLLEALDTFYDDPDHLDLNLRWAVMVVMQMQHSAAPEDVPDAIRPTTDPDS